MRVEYDEAVDAAYIYLHPIQQTFGVVKRTIQATDEINLDFDAKGRMVGIEVLCASRQLHLPLIKWIPKEGR